MDPDGEKKPRRKKEKFSCDLINSLLTQQSEAVLLLARPLSPPCGWMVSTQLESLNVDAAGGELLLLLLGKIKKDYANFKEPQN